MARRLVAGALFLVAIGLIDAFLPRLLGNPYYLRILTLCGINIILAVSLNLVNGMTGQFSIGHAGFMAVGGYGAAVLSMRGLAPLLAGLTAAGLPPAVTHGAVLLVATLAGGLLAALAGWAVGLPSLRLRGDYLAIVTLGFGEIIRVFILNIDAVGGARGLSGVPQYANLFWVLLWVGIVIAVSYNLLGSTHGRALLAIREDEIAAEALGVDTTRYKVIAFVVSSFFAGVAGALFAHYDSYLNPASFTFLRSIEIITMVVLGGMGSIFGALVGAAVLVVLPQVLTVFQDYEQALLGLLIMVFMIFLRRGIVPSLATALAGWRR
jgi:branched-chain amino acid transport system permease protein